MRGAQLENWVRKALVALLLWSLLLVPVAAAQQPSWTCPAPAWWNPAQESGWIVVTASAASLDLQTAYDKAVYSARVQLGEAIGAEVKVITERLVEEVDSANTSRFIERFRRSVTATASQRIAGTTPDRKSSPCQEEGRWRAYVQLSYPHGEIWRGFVEEVEVERKQDPAAAARIEETEEGGRIREEYDRYDPTQRRSVK